LLQIRNCYPTETFPANGKKSSAKTSLLSVLILITNNNNQTMAVKR